MPRDAEFYSLFAQVAGRMSGSADLLHELFKDPSKIEEHEAAIKTLEHEADYLTHDTIDRIDRLSEVLRRGSSPGFRMCCSGRS